MDFPRQKNFKRNERGAALLLVIWALTLMLIIMASLSTFVDVEITSAAHNDANTQAYYLARTAVSHGLSYALRFDLKCVQDQDGLVYYYSPDEKNFKELQRVSQIYQPYITREEKEWAGLNQNLKFDTGRYTFLILDECAKVDINYSMDKGLIEQLLYVGAGMEKGSERSDLANSIMDWIDAEAPDVTRVGGAEDDYYTKLDPPYHARNYNLGSIEELLLVKGMTREILYGAEDTPGLAKMITVYGGARNKASAGYEVSKVLEPRTNRDDWDSPFKEGGVRGVERPTVARIIGEGRMPDGTIHRISAVAKISFNSVELVYWNDNYTDKEFDSVFAARAEEQIPERKVSSF